MMALYQYKRFLTLGPKGSEGDKCNHAGVRAGLHDAGRRVEAEEVRGRSHLVPK